MAILTTFDITEYLAYAHAITAAFGHKGESVSKTKHYVNLAALA